MNIKIGACTGFTNAPFIAEIGSQAIEPAYATITAMPDEQFDKELDMFLSTGMDCASMNCMLPGDSVLYGTDEQTQSVCDFVRRGMARAAKAGCKSICFGAGRLRNVPEGMTKEEACERFAAIVARFCAIADEFGLKIAIEPLRTAETTLIHTLADAYDIIRRIPECKNLGINPDMYHMYENGDDFSELVKYKDYVFNVHTAEPKTRAMPKPTTPENEAVYLSFFNALKQAGYQGNVSIEAITRNFNGEVADAIKYLSDLVATV